MTSLTSGDALEATRRRVEMTARLDQLKAAKGTATSMVSLYIAPHQQIPLVRAKLESELGFCVNIKDTHNRLSVQAALRSTLAKLALYKRIPANGLAIFSGVISSGRGRDDRICETVEPLVPLTSGQYRCGPSFFTEPLERQLTEQQQGSKFGFVVIDGSGALFATLCVHLPRKHGRGGQSALRFARLALEARHNFVVRAAELANEVFIGPDQKLNVEGIIVAGSASLKNDLVQSALLDPRVARAVLRLLDVAYSGPAGLQEAIALSQDLLRDVRYNQERVALAALFETVAQGAVPCAFGPDEVLAALSVGAVQRLIVWEGIDQPAPQQLGGREDERLVSWLVRHCTERQIELTLVTDSTKESQQLIRGFDGIAAVLFFAVQGLLGPSDGADDEAACAELDAPDV